MSETPRLKTADTVVTTDPLQTTNSRSIGHWIVANFPIAILILLTAIVFAPAVGFDFVNWDDPWYITNNDLIKSWSPSNLWKIGTESVARNYAPITIGSFLVDHTLWGSWAGGYHLTNILLHIVNVVLVFVLIKQLTKSPFAAFATAALFAIHPVQIETVAWVSSRKGLLSAVFILSSLVYYLRPHRTVGDEGKGLLLFVVALFCKAIAVVVPVVVIAYDVIVRKVKLMEAITRQAVPCLFSGLMILATASSQTTIVGGVRGHIGMSKFQLFFVDATLFWRYIYMLVCPTDLCVLYDPPTSGILGLMLLSVVGCAAIVWLCFRNWKTSPMTVFAVTASFLFLVPVLNLFPITTLMNDRYLYLPCIGAFAVVATGLEWLVTSARTSVHTSVQISRGWQVVRRGLLHGAAAAIILTYTIMTSQHLSTWKDPHSLWSHAMSKQPQIVVIQIQWAHTLEKEGRIDEAIAVLEYTIEHYTPDAPDRKRIQEKIDRWRS